MASLLSNIITADTRVEIITWFIFNQDKKTHMRELARSTGRQVNAISRELYNLVSIGLLHQEKVGKKKYFRVNTNFLLYDELEKIVHKTMGLGARIIAEKGTIGNIEVAILTNNFLRNIHKGQYDVDLLLVGDVHIPVATHVIKEVEKEIGKEVKYTVMKMEEFDFRRKKKDVFIDNIINNNKVVVIGGHLF